MDQELESRERDAVEGHIAVCAECAGWLGLRTTGVDPQLDGLVQSALAPTLLALSGMSATPRLQHEDVDLEPGARVQRYDIRARLGAGAMGTVYEAYDPDLDRLVAVKILKTEAWGGSAGEDLRQRLLREARAMARLSHPNVVTVHDVGTFGEQLFVAMELVRGTTLRGWLSEKRRSVAEVLGAYASAGAGLAAAHDAGLVHRDFKPDNVLVGEDGRVRVTDFGLARARSKGIDETATLGSAPSRASGDSAASDKLTRSGVVVGTPAYMAPEQSAGGEADARSDIFAFSVALYEALYSERPFEGSTVTELMANIRAGRIREAPRAPHVPSAVRRTLVRGLAATREARPASMHVMLADLARASKAPRATRWALGVGVVVIAACVAAWLVARGSTGRMLPTDGRRPVIAVLDFRPTSGDGGESAWLGRSLARGIAVEMGAGEKARAMSPDDLARNGFAGSPTVDEPPDLAALARLRDDLGAGYVVTGTYQVEGAGDEAHVRLDARIVAASTGKVLREARQKGTLADAREMSLAAADDLGEALGLRALSGEERAAVRATLPANPDAMRAYARALDRMLAFDALGARALFEEAVALEPSAPMLHAALARALAEIGYDDLARSEARLALERSSDLARADRLTNEALVHELASEWDKAAEIQRALFTFFPDNLEYGLRLANAIQRAGKSPEARQTIDGLRASAVAASDRVRIELADAMTSRYLGDPARTVASSKAAAMAADAMGSLHLRAQALHAQAAGHMGLHQMDAAMVAAAEAMRLFAAVGDRGRESLARQVLGELEADAGDLEGAQRRFEDALVTLRAMGKLRAVAGILGDLVVVEKRRERYEAARARSNEGEAVAFAEAPQERAVSSHNSGEILSALGDLAGAHAKHDEALELRKKAGDKRGLAFSLAAISEIQIAQGDLEGAAQSLSEAGAVDTKDEKVRALVATDVGRLALEQGRPESSLVGVSTACESFRAGKRMSLEVLCRGVEARILRVTGRAADAVALLDRSAPLLGGGGDVRAARVFGIDDAYVRGMVGPAEARTAAITRLDGFIARAHEVGCIGDELDARLARSLVEIASGRAPRESLASIAKDATSRGFLRIAAHANARNR